MENVKAVDVSGVGGLERGGRVAAERAGGTFAPQGGDEAARIDEAQRSDEAARSAETSQERMMRAMPGVGPGRWRRKAHVLEWLNLTADDVSLPIPAMLQQGLHRLWAVREALQSPVEYSGEVPEELKEVMAAKGEAWSAAHWKAHHFDRPVWRVISGLGSANDHDMAPEKRSECVRKLLGAVLHFLKFEMDQADAENDDWRSYMWDPLPKVCLYFEISRAQLSRFAKEEMGLAAHELVDGIRINKLRARMKEAVRDFVAAAVKASDLRGRELSLDVWTKLKATRKAPVWDRNAWAIGLAFPNYARMYRASLVLWGKTPAQVEFEEIEALCGELVECAEQETGDCNADRTLTGENQKGGSTGAAGEDCTSVQFFDGGMGAVNPAGEQSVKFDFQEEMERARVAG